MNAAFLEKIEARAPGICLYGLVPPKLATPTDELRAIAAHQAERIERMDLDGVIVYDIGDESDRTPEPRPFPFLPVVLPDAYANEHLGRLRPAKIVYRRVNRDTPDSFVEWLTGDGRPDISVLVGAPTRRADLSLPLSDAYALVKKHAPDLVLGGIAIAERHTHRFDEHERILAKTEMGCRFFVTQSVYDVTSTKSLISDYSLALRDAPVSIILTFAPCGSEKTLEFMKWLGIAFPRWLENELRHAPDPLATSMKLCEELFAEIWDYARAKGVPVGVNVESVSIRKAEIDASVELAKRLRELTKR
ncbi:MAG: 5,10-methylenetetrahydrofolate reductase [Actinomycetota bacterium]